jgi:hypothetical protein
MMPKAKSAEAMLKVVQIENAVSGRKNASGVIRRTKLGGFRFGERLGQVWSRAPVS